MAYRPRGKARVDPEYPEAFAICDRCGALYNRRSLQRQHQWQGSNLHDLQILVCEDCHDRPSSFLRALIVPADPQPVFNARAEPYSIDEMSDWDLRGPPGAPGAVDFEMMVTITATLTVA